MASRTVATWFTLIASLLSVLAARALVAQVLGPVGLGLYALLLTAAWLGGTVLSLGLPTYNASFAGKQAPAVLLSNAIAWNVAAFLVLTAVCGPWLAFAHPSATRTFILIGVWMAPFASLLECTRGVILGSNVLGLYNWLGLTGGVVNLAGIAVLASTSRLTLAGAAACWAVATAVTAVLAVTLAATRTGGLGRVDGAVLRESVRFGGQAWLSQLTGILNFRIALLLTQALLGTAAVGIYAIAVTIAELLFYFPNALAAVTVSRYASASRPQAGALLWRSIAWVLAVSTASALALAVVGGPFIARVFGPAYTGSFAALLILLPGVVLYTPVAICAWFFNAHVQKPGVNLLVAGVSAIVNGLLTLAWAPRYGLAGVAWATTTAYAGASILNVVMIGRELARETSVLPAYVPSAGSAGLVTRLSWRTLRAVDFVVAVFVHLLMPRATRERWFMPGTQLRNRRACDEVYALLDGAPRSRVLDVGGGAAALAGTLGADPRVRAVTLDLDLDVLRRAATRAAGLRLVCADATRLPFADDTFDAIVMVHALEHIPMEVRGPLAAEIKRVSRRGVVIHGPAGDAAVTLSQRFIAALSARGLPVPRYAFEHLDFSMPMPAWFSATFPGCELRPRRNFDVELATIMTEFTPLVRWLSGYRHRRLVATDDRPPFVEYTMTWRKPGPGAIS